MLGSDALGNHRKGRVTVRADGGIERAGETAPPEQLAALTTTYSAAGDPIAMEISKTDSVDAAVEWLGR